MKKLLSLLMAVAILATTLVVPIMAEDTAPRNINDHLTIHYDFLGDANSGDNLKDKAPAGSSADNLTYSAGSSTGFSVASGSLTATWGQKNVPFAASNADTVNANVGNGTWFVRIKSSGLNADTAVIDFRNDTAKPFYLCLKSTGDIVINAEGKGAMTFDANYDFNSGKWLNIAAVRTIAKDASNTDCYYYYLYSSVGNAALTYLGRYMVKVATESLTSAEGVSLGFFNQAGKAWSNAYELAIDDIRYYNTDLTVAELGKIMDNNSFEPDLNRSIDDHMTIHYDFEGNTVAEKLADKATVGTGDTLQFNTGSSDGFVLENGAVTSATASKNHLYAPISADTISSNTGEGTWFFRFKSSALTANAPILDFRAGGTSRPLYVYLTTAGKVELVTANASAPNGVIPANYTAWWSGGPTYPFETSPWMNIAAVRNVDCVGGVNYYYYTLYTSFGDANSASDWTKVGRVQIAAVEVGLAPADNVRIGLFNQAGVTWPTTTGLTIDDVRYYDTELTVGEIASILDANEMADEKTEFIGYQVSKTYTVGSESFYKLRLIGEIDSRDYDEAGVRMTVTVNGVSKTTVNPVSRVFTSLLTDYGNGIKTASEGKYLFAIVIEDIPADVLPTVAVTTYAKANGTTHYCGNPESFTVSANDFA